MTLMETVFLQMKKAIESKVLDYNKRLKDVVFGLKDVII